MYPQTMQDVDRSLQAIGALRCAFGAGCLPAPALALAGKGFGLRC